MDKQEAHGAGAEDGVGGVRGGTAGFEGQGERRLEGEEPEPLFARLQAELEAAR